MFNGAQKVTSVLLAILVLILASAFYYLSQREGGDRVVAPTHKIKLQLQWFDQAQFAGFYVAEKNGYFEDEGLNVKIIPGGYGINPIVQLTSGAADIALATGDQVLIHGVNGSDIKAIATVYRESLLCFMSKQSSNISNIQDLRGKVVGVYQGFDSENILYSLLRKHNLSPEELSIVPAGSIAAFDDGSVDVWPSYVINEPIRQKEKGNLVDCLDPAQFGVEYYSDTIISTSKYLKENRDAVIGFLRASKRGWLAAKGNPAQAVRDMIQVSQTIDRGQKEVNFQVKSAEEATKHLHRENEKLLSMNEAHWLKMANDLISIGKLPKIEAHKIVPNIVSYEYIKLSGDED